MSPNEIPICPKCGESNPRRRAGGIGRSHHHASDHDYRCVDPECGYEFDAYELDHREPKSGLDPTNSERVDALLEADPELVPDGGEERVRACPECDSSSFKFTGNGTSIGGPEGCGHAFICSACDHQFDEPVERPPEQSGDHRRGLSRALVEADPGDLVTDGGEEQSPVLESAAGMPGTSAADGSAIPDAAAHFQQAADLVQGGDPDGARHAAEKALRLLEDEP